MNLLKRFSSLEKETGSSFPLLNDLAKIVFLYSFYHYEDGDITKFDDIYDSLCYPNLAELGVGAVFPSVTMDGHVLDFVCTIAKSTFDFTTQESLKELLESLGDNVNKVILRDPSAKAAVSRVYNNIGFKHGTDEDSMFIIKLLCDWEPTPEKKIKLQDFVSQQTGSRGRISFELIFRDDIEQEINDIESPKEYVEQGILRTFGDGSVCNLGEGSVVTVISAKSLKEMFYHYSTKGLFASNLRFYIVSKKIDPKIMNTINSEPENFCFYNNGIIVTCSDYNIQNGLVLLKDFSIVNGGQTTNLIGRTPFEHDFGIVCKIIKNKYSAKEQNVSFLAKVAEASNTQKPINAVDLIANRVEQRLLKEQFSNCRMFLKIKRGERLNKELFPEPWQTASNDEIAQLIYSSVYQNPGAAKNSKSSILSNDKTYNLIFSEKYCDDFFVSIQHLKVHYSNWKKQIAKTEAKSSEIYGLSKYGDLVSIAAISLFIKLFTNKSVEQYVNSLTIQSINHDNETLKTYLSQNDIGCAALLKPDIVDYLDKRSLMPIFDYLFREIFSNSYRSFRRDYPGYSYAQFNKTNKYYYDYVIPNIVRAFREDRSDLEGGFMPFLNIRKNNTKDPINKCEEKIPSVSLNDALLEYRKKKIDQGIRGSDVFAATQLSSLVRNLPRNVQQLKDKCGFKDEQTRRFGTDILEIIEKYCKLYETK